MARLRVVLAGGPDELRKDGGVAEAAGLDDRVKILFASGYEHFSRSGEFAEVDGEVLPVFRWCARTKIAE